MVKNEKLLLQADSVHLGECLVVELIIEYLTTKDQIVKPDHGIKRTPGGEVPRERGEVSLL